MRQLNGQDAQFLWLENERMAMHAGMIYIYDPSAAPGGKVSFTDILQSMSERMHMSLVFRQKLATVPFDLDHPYWVEDESFDIQNHIHHTALPEPRDWRQFCIQIARLHAVPLDRSRPLWEMHVIEGLDNVAGAPKGSYAVFIKVHHAAIDGRTAMEITKTLHAENPTPKSDQDTDAGEGHSPKPGLAAMAMRAWGKAITSPLNVKHTVLKAVPKLPKVLMERLSGDSEAPSLLTRPPKTRLGRNVSPHRIWDSRRLDLAEIKQIRQQVKGTTVNDVILSICGGALRKYLQSKADLPKKSLIAMVPIDVATEKERKQAGNAVSLMSMSLRSDIADPVERLQMVKEASKTSKAMTDAIGARELTTLNKNFPGILHVLTLRLVMGAKIGKYICPWNTVVSNMAGPRKPLYMKGAKLLRFMPTGPCLDGMGVEFGVVSYNGGIEITLIGCRKIVPDPGFLADCVQDAFDELKAGTLAATEPFIAKRSEAPARAQKKRKAAPAKGTARTTAKKKAVPAKGTARAPVKKKAAPAKGTARTTAKKKAAPAKGTARTIAKKKAAPTKRTARRTKAADKK